MNQTLPHSLESVQVQVQVVEVEAAGYNPERANATQAPVPLGAKTEDCFLARPLVLDAARVNSQLTAGSRAASGRQSLRRRLSTEQLWQIHHALLN
jgi:hypothetical protein